MASQGTRFQPLQQESVRASAPARLHGGVYVGVPLPDATRPRHSIRPLVMVAEGESAGENEKGRAENDASGKRSTRRRRIVILHPVMGNRSNRLAVR